MKLRLRRSALAAASTDSMSCLLSRTVVATTLGSGLAGMTSVNHGGSTVATHVLELPPTR